MTIQPAVKTLVAIRYHRDGRPWDAEVRADPTWDEVEAALHRMDDDAFPIVVLSALEGASDEMVFADEDSFHLIGGDGRYAMFQNTGPWQYSDGSGDDAPVRLWQSDQGYFCEAHNLADLPTVLRLARVFLETADFEAVEQASLNVRPPPAPCAAASSG